MGFEASGVCSRGPGWVVGPIWRAGRGQKPTCRPGRSREDHPDVRDAHTEVWEGLGGPPRGPKGVGRPTRRFGRGWEGQLGGGRLLESVPEVLDGLRVPSGGPGEVGSPPVGLGGVRRTTQMFGKPTQRYGRGREAHAEVRQWLGGPPKGLRGIGSLTRRSLRGREA